MNIWLRRLFLILSIGGGFAGFTITSVQLIEGTHPLIFYVLSVVACLAYLQGVVAGLRLVENEPDGLRLLFWYNVAQIPVLTSPVLSYLFWAGASLNITLGSNGVKWFAGYGGRWQIGLFQFGDLTFAVGVNFVALWAAWYLWKLRQRQPLYPPPGPVPPLVAPAAEPASPQES